MLSSFYLYTVLMATCFTVPTRCQLQIGELTGKSAGIKLKRSLVAIGNAAIKKLLDGAKFLYSNGLDNVYIKPGGFKQAQKDFDSVNTAKLVLKLPESDKISMSRVGKVGNKNLILKENSYTGFTSLTISELPRYYFSGAKSVDPIIDKIIIYTDNIID